MESWHFIYLHGKEKEEDMLKEAENYRMIQTLKKDKLKHNICFLLNKAGLFLARTSNYFSKKWKIEAE